MDSRGRDDLIEKLAQLEVEMDAIRRRLPGEVSSLDKLLNSVDQLNSLGKDRDTVKEKLK